MREAITVPLHRAKYRHELGCATAWGRRNGWKGTCALVMWHFGLEITKSGPRNAYAAQVRSGTGSTRRGVTLYKHAPKPQRKKQVQSLFIKPATR
jgi:hypothetical protein